MLWCKNNLFNVYWKNVCIYHTSKFLILKHLTPPTTYVFPGFPKKQSLGQAYVLIIGEFNPRAEQWEWGKGGNSQGWLGSNKRWNVTNWPLWYNEETQRATLQLYLPWHLGCLLMGYRMKPCLGTVHGKEEEEVFGFSSPIGDQLPWTYWLCCPAHSAVAWKERFHALWCIRSYIPSGAWLTSGSGTTWALKEQVGTEKEWVTEGPVHGWGQENLKGVL